MTPDNGYCMMYISWLYIDALSCDHLLESLPRSCCLTETISVGVSRGAIAVKARKSART